jgi:hypothetical protein
VSILGVAGKARRRLEALKLGKFSASREKVVVLSIRPHDLVLLLLMLLVHSRAHARQVGRHSSRVLARRWREVTRVRTAKVQ